MISLNVHGVARAEAEAFSLPMDNGLRMNHWQELTFFNSIGEKIGSINIFLSDPFAALAVGDCSRLLTKEPRIESAEDIPF